MAVAVTSSVCLKSRRTARFATIVLRPFLRQPDVGVSAVVCHSACVSQFFSYETLWRWREHLILHLGHYVAPWTWDRCDTNTIPVPPASVVAGQRQFLSLRFWLVPDACKDGRCYSVAWQYVRTSQGLDRAPRSLCVNVQELERPSAVRSMPWPETSYASCGDLSLAYQVFGDGPVELVFVGPFVSHVELFWTVPEFKAFIEPARHVLSRPPVRQGRGRAVGPGPESSHAG